MMKNQQKKAHQCAICSLFCLLLMSIMLFYDIIPVITLPALLLFGFGANIFIIMLYHKTTTTKKPFELALLTATCYLIMSISYSVLFLSNGESLIGIILIFVCILVGMIATIRNLQILAP